MELHFNRIARGVWIPTDERLIAYLTDDNWDDFLFRTLYYLTVLDEDGDKFTIGGVKIGFFGQEEGSRTEIDSRFKTLGDEFFSLGQDSEYYQNILKLTPELRQSILSGLNDVVANESLLEAALREEVMNTSLLRGVSLPSVTGQFRRILRGGAPLTEYNFQYSVPQSRHIAGVTVDFQVDPDSNPPSNIHVLIGRNGVGKTKMLNNMVEALVDENRSPKTVGEFSTVGVSPGATTKQELFSGVVSIAFSAFDTFEPYPEKKDKSGGVRYSYVGLKRSTNRGGAQGTPMSHEMLTNEFVKSMMACFALGKGDRWVTALRTLESDPLFKEAELERMPSMRHGEELKRKAETLFQRMSSGHEIVLLTVTKLVEKVEEKTLVLIDEPESHLHPPLLSALIRATSDLLTHRNGVAIIATHSPVVLQEVPRNCVWKLRRTGLQASAERPEVETFGENVGVLTREVFGLEVTESGYHRLLRDSVARRESFGAISRSYEHSLGSEARGILRCLIAERDSRGE